MGQKRILHIITQLDVGGAERQLLNLCARLPADRYVCRVITLAGTDALAPEFRALGVTLRRLSRPDTGGPVGQLLALAAEIRAWRPDILQTWLLKANHVGRLAAALAAPGPLIATYRDMGFDAGAGDTWLDGLLDPFTQLILHNSRRGRRAFQTRVPSSPAGKHRILPNGIDSERLRPDSRAREDLRRELGLANDTPVVAMVARLHPIKDPRLFLSIAAMTTRRLPSARFWLLGGGPMEAELRAEVEARGLTHVWLAGERDDIPRLLAAADLAMLTSSSEGLSNSILEAMSCGLPVLATDVGGNAELVTDDLNGYLLRCREPEAIVPLVERVLRDGKLASRLGQAGRRMVMENYSLDRLGERAASIYGSLLDKR